MRRLLWIVFLALWSGGPATGPLATQEPEVEQAVVRLLPPPPGRSSGSVRIEALLIEPEPWRVVFYLDGVEVDRRKLPPWETKVSLDTPPREQIVGVEVVAKSGSVLGSDEIVLNRERKPLRVAIESIETDATGVLVRANVSIPEGLELENVLLFLNDEEVETRAADELADGVLEARFERAASSPTDFVRIAARLRDGRLLEDVELVESAGFSEELDVRLVQLQVLVTDKRGAPVKDLELDQFQIREGRAWTAPDGLFVADDVSLLLGLALDSSGSMQPIWPATRQAASSFLERTVSDRDEGFLVDFDDRLRLVRARTGNVELLESGLDELVPEGGTALFDSILFSLLQFERQPGRRGLVVLTDGVDVHSHSDPKRVIEFGKKLGVPIYLLALEPRMRSVPADPNSGQYPGPPGQNPGVPGQIPGNVPGPVAGQSPGQNPGQQPGQPGGGGNPSYPGQTQPRTMPGAGGYTGGRSRSGSSSQGGTLSPTGGGSQVHSLRLLAEPTGGRLFRIASVDHMLRAFGQINAEMRNQYVLTYYTDSPPKPGDPPDVKVSVPGKKGLKVTVVFGADQVY
jgi:VWFA-related protein